MENALSGAAGGRSALAEVVREYFLVCHRMSNQIQLMYQVTKSLPAQWKRKVLENEIQITTLIGDALKQLVTSGGLPVVSENVCDLLANNICVLGHMWTFRHWHLSQKYTIEEYIKLQTDFITGNALP